MRQKRFSVLLTVTMAAILLCGCGPKRVKRTDDITLGIDVAKYQGSIDWSAVAADGVEFAMVRVGSRSMTDGSITEDSNARYNLQEAAKYNIPVGTYFFSTAITEEEAEEEAQWVMDIIDQYPITYPVVYDCEGFTDPESRQFTLTRRERTDNAIAFMKAVEKAGYEAMFYASKAELDGENQWETERIQEDYLIWVAQYPEQPYPQTPASSYEGVHHMWQYTAEGAVSGIQQPVDRNIAYFGYEGINTPLSDEEPPEATADPEALMVFEPVQEVVTAKEVVNLRSSPEQADDSNVVAQMENGQEAMRIGISDSGWSKIQWNGGVYYVVSSRITTNMYYEAPPEFEAEDTDNFETRFVAVNEKVTPKIETNLRNMPSVDHPDSKVVVLLKNGEIVTRTGINEEVGWSRVVYDDQILYCVSQYMMLAE